MSGQRGGGLRERGGRAWKLVTLADEEGTHFPLRGQNVKIALADQGGRGGINITIQICRFSYFKI